MTNEKEMKNYERRPPLETSRVGFGWDSVICASSFLHILAHQLFLVGALVSFLAADQAVVIKID